jgi:hypothetical protein
MANIVIFLRLRITAKTGESRTLFPRRQQGICHAKIHCDCPIDNALQIVAATTAVNCIRPLYRLLRPPERNAARRHNSRDVDEDTGPVRGGLSKRLHLGMSPRTLIVVGSARGWPIARHNDRGCRVDNPRYNESRSCLSLRSKIREVAGSASAGSKSGWRQPVRQLMSGDRPPVRRRPLVHSGLQSRLGTVGSDGPTQAVLGGLG